VSETVTSTVPQGSAAGEQHLLDVRDLVTWLLRCAQDGTTGTYDTVGPVMAFGDRGRDLR